MPALQIRWSRQPDGGAVLRCTRPDGSTTWQRQEGRQAAFFPLHDLTHYAVETVLGFRHGFFGLVAGGWDIDDTSGKGARGPLPREAVLVEHLVGLLDVERATHAHWTADAYAHQLSVAGVDATAAPRALTDASLRLVRLRRDELLATWSAVEPGSHMDLEFPSPADRIDLTA